MPVILPGAFAISSRHQTEEPNTGYDSGFEEESVQEGDVECQNVEENREGEERASTFRPEVPDNPVEAELYEEHLVTAAVINEGVEETDNGHGWPTRYLDWWHWK